MVEILGLVMKFLLFFPEGSLIACLNEIAICELSFQCIQSENRVSIPCCLQITFTRIAVLEYAIEEIDI